MRATAEPEGSLDLRGAGPTVASVVFANGLGTWEMGGLSLAIATRLSST